MSAAHPPLSVVMPVRNALPYLDAAVTSILRQSFGDFEFVIRDDHSTDGSLEALRAWAERDSRIRLFEGKSSLGPAGSSNWVVERASAPLIARMDADDISLPHRLERQLEILTRDSEAVLVGCVWEGIDRKGHVVREPDLSQRFGTLSAPFAHGSILFRRAAFDAAGGYRKACDFWEDLDLYVRMARSGTILVLPEAHYRHRFSETSTRLTSGRAHVEASIDLMFRCQQRYDSGMAYDDLLEDAGGADPAGRLHPGVFLSTGFIDLWSGLRPPTLGRLLRRARLRFDAASLQALVWAGWAAVEPRTLRFVMRLLLRRRSRRAARGLSRADPWRWHPRASDRSNEARSRSKPAGITQ